MSAKGFLLMTALPPTVGHRYLINFSERYCMAAGLRHLVVLVCGQPHEPIPAKTRADIIKEQRKEDGHATGVLVEILYVDKVMPQEPEDAVDFWQQWKDIISSVVMLGSGDIIFASELYGAKLATLFGCTFVNANVYRDILSVSASKIRMNPIENFSSILPVAQRLFRKTITVFGPESTGKTTLAKTLAEWLNGYFVPEWAREYLEIQPSPETTLDRMTTIVHGQYASQETVFRMVDKPFIIQDTDLLSTAGFYKLYNWSPDLAMQHFIAADHYLLMSDEIPFTPDPLRYGGDKREAGTDFWQGVLEDAKVPYTLITGQTRMERAAKARRVCTDLFLDHPLWGYKRH